MSTESTPKDAQPPTLCAGAGISYKAYSLPFMDVRALCILATCWFDRAEIEVSLVPNSAPNSFKFVQQSPAFTPFLDTFYAAHWTSGIYVEKPPESITITDAYGTHEVKVVTSR
jgi:hypothetical protein